MVSFLKSLASHQTSDDAAVDWGRLRFKVLVITFDNIGHI